MGLLFKIFLLLCLQNAQSTKGEAGSVDIERILVSGDVSLSISAEPSMMDQLVSICIAQEPNCEVVSEEGMATVKFKQFPFYKKEVLEKRLQPFQSNARLQIQWTAALISK
jgi:hypothetical protein